MSSLDALTEPSLGDSSGSTYAFASCHVVSLGFELNSLINQLTNQLFIYVMHSQPHISFVVVACTSAESHSSATAESQPCLTPSESERKESCLMCRLRSNFRCQSAVVVSSTPQSSPWMLQCTEGRSAASHLCLKERRGCARWCLVFVNGRRR